MVRDKHTLIIGIGSPHGDDQIGWLAIDELLLHGELPCRAIKVSNPLQCLDHLDRAERVLIIDAAVGMDVCVLSMRYDASSQWDDCATINTKDPRGTHDLGLPSVLELALNLGHRVDHVEIWLVRGSQFQPLSAVSEAALAGTHECVQRIVQEVADARNILGA
ncbi:hypothetical protein [Stieleria varia]|uniref:Hydrogenase maturation protease n=1 Tax=Stieleria varia TaxID=2528005 RepID=A0A5C5ZVR1_9BACT|nr:hypothetical protein [Stieleria varia]TWT91270.1 hypothetical protein Pla52n_66820 [Stieleria varia]